MNYAMQKEMAARSRGELTSPGLALGGSAMNAQQGRQSTPIEAAQQHAQSALSTLESRVEQIHQRLDGIMSPGETPYAQPTSGIDAPPAPMSDIARSYHALADRMEFLTRVLTITLDRLEV